MAIISTIVGAVVLLVRKLTNRKISPKCNYIIWLVFVFALVCPVSVPSSISIYNYIDVASIKDKEKEYSNYMLKIASETDNNSDRKESLFEARNRIIDNRNKIHRDYLIFIISDIWFVVCMVKLSKVIYSYIVLNKLTGKDEIEDERIIEIFERCKKKLKIKRDIKLIKQDLIKTPSITGIVHVKIFLTEEACSWNDIYLTDIFMHELSHYKKKDNVMKMIMMVSSAIYWFNPFFYIFFKNMKNDIELATDEMAVKHLEPDEESEYCEVIINIAGIRSSKVEAVLGMADDIKILEKRVDMVLLKEKFEKNAKLITISTVVIVLLMWFLFYPTSYGIFDVPKLYLKLEDGTKIETQKIEENDISNIETIKISKNENIKFLTEGGSCKDYINFTILDLKNEKIYAQAVNIKSDEISYFQVGEFIYKFQLEYGKNKTVNYAIRMIVE